MDARAEHEVFRSLQRYADGTGRGRPHHHPDHAPARQIRHADQIIVLDHAGSWKRHARRAED